MKTCPPCRGEGNVAADVKVDDPVVKYTAYAVILIILFLDAVILISLFLGASLLCSQSCGPRFKSWTEETPTHWGSDGKRVEMKPGICECFPVALGAPDQRSNPSVTASGPFLDPARP